MTSNEAQTQQQEEAVITLEGEDGHSYSCQILDIFEFDNQEYALLLKMGEPEKTEEAEAADDEGSLVIMRLVQRDDQSIFQTIESDEEFERVVKHVEELAAAAEEEHSHD
ncbi:MAG: DUF1292 domain-containing protein [Candidatus Obscuribacterales bacterium]|jgi:uncharacterized protein YrzB (UPF0473 family)|nr:DUF1292 domain-containing protein [Candidatus Obscuribacterales bacterium]